MLNLRIWLVLLPMIVAINATATEFSCPNLLSSQATKVMKISGEGSRRLKEVLPDYDISNDLVVGVNESRHAYLIAPGGLRFDGSFMSKVRITQLKGDPVVPAGLVRVFKNVTFDNQLVNKLKNCMTPTCVYPVGGMLSAAGLISALQGSIFKPESLIKILVDLGLRPLDQVVLLNTVENDVESFRAASTFLGGDWWSQGLLHCVTPEAGMSSDSAASCFREASRTSSKTSSNASSDSSHESSQGEQTECIMWFCN